MPEHVRRNREGWNRTSDDYQKRHGAQLAEAKQAWGTWSIPEAELRVLGDVVGKDVLELGCGAAQWSIALALAGARPVGFDLSDQQLGHARKAREAVAARFPLVQGDGECTPFADRSFDIVFCDHGALSFTEPERTVPEVARILRPGGLFAFNAESPLHALCWDEQEVLSDALHKNYFELRSYDDELVSFTRPYGEWIRLFRSSGFSVEDLIELRPPEGATTSYQEYASLDWARRWPGENIWKLRRL